MGKAISLSVERFVTVGETIGEEGGRDPTRGGSSREQQRNNSDGQARKDMLEACRESRHTGKLVEKLAENLAVQVKITREKPRVQMVWGKFYNSLFFEILDIFYLTF